MNSLGKVTETKTAHRLKEEIGVQKTFSEMKKAQ